MKTRLSNRIEQAMSRLEGNDPSRDKPIVLIVDDEKGPRESLRMILSPQHRVLVAENGHEALELLRSNEVAAMTLDLNMPGMKGDEVMRAVRKEFPHVEVIVITGCSSVESAVDGIRHGVFDYLTKPFDVVEVSTTLHRALIRRESRTRLIAFLDGIGKVLGHERDPEQAVAELSSSAELQRRLTDALADPVLAPPADRANLTTERTTEFLESLAETIESREDHRRGHSRRVAFLGGLLGERLGLSQQALEDLRIASFLHDIGRIGLTRADHLLSDAERNADRTHALIGAQLIEPLGFDTDVAAAIRHHHERWDGTGSPSGLAENNIPLASRIIAIADAFDALTNDHPYRRALSASAALETLRKQAGSQFDPAIFRELASVAESGLCASGPLSNLAFTADEDPVDTIAAAAAWIETTR